MLQLQLGENLTPLTIDDLLDRFSKLSSSRSTQILQTFIVEEKYMPKDPPPYMSSFFSGIGKDITSMISCILGFTTSEYVDDIIFSYMSIFTPGQPVVVKFDYAKFISDKTHDQFMRLENK